MVHGAYAGVAYRLPPPSHEMSTITMKQIKQIRHVLKNIGSWEKQKI